MEQKLQPQPKPQPQTQQNFSQKSPKKLQDKFPNLKPNHIKKAAVWDCGSTLYDSFELNSFQKQLDSAIINSSRTHSMPRLPSEERRAPPLPPPPSKKPLASKVSRSFQKLLRSVFRTHKQPNHLKPEYDNSRISSPDPWFMDHYDDDDQVLEKGKMVDGGRYFVVYEKPNGLSSIPEVPEVGFSPDISSLVRKTMSARFTTPPDLMVK
ncbi:hypothetical protein SOVF_066820 [Spinacia oleracea]|uniref:Enhancer of mRNA-decapping protein 1 n=1 Tax=Spinacia oleracea TaxID=3562 RepID=A0A9R0IC93_SPIOL|nr:enhancer of mRNA-decapping protein 1 [Spinacia oleracea]KNA18882.1 hypothetical protein SOVF_066820 [Spinacia oleracea]